MSVAYNFISELTQLVASFVAHYSNFDIDLKYPPHQITRHYASLDLKVIGVTVYKKIMQRCVLDDVTRCSDEEVEQPIVFLIPYFCVRYDRL